jgi:hypothetical protein
LNKVFADNICIQVQVSVPLVLSNVKFFDVCNVIILFNLVFNKNMFCNLILSLLPESANTYQGVLVVHHIGLSKVPPFLTVQLEQLDELYTHK